MCFNTYVALLICFQLQRNAHLTSTKSSRCNMCFTHLIWFNIKILNIYPFIKFITNIQWQNSTLEFLYINLQGCFHHIRGADKQLIVKSLTLKLPWILSKQKLMVTPKSEGKYKKKCWRKVEQSGNGCRSREHALKVAMSRISVQDEWRSGRICQTLYILNNLMFFVIQQSSVFKTCREYFSNHSEVRNEE